MRSGMRNKGESGESTQEKKKVVKNTKAEKKYYEVLNVKEII